jgi:hypothetical protein
VGEADRCREGGPLPCDGATVIGAMGWLGLARLAWLAGHGLGERETEQRERTRATISRRHGGGWRGGW